MTIEQFIARLESNEDSDLLTNEYKNPIKAKNLATYLNF